MKRHLLSLLLLVMGCLFGCGVITTTVHTNNWIIDDGIVELTPEYNVQHIQGQPYTDVYAAFNAIAQKKTVQLRDSATIAVNGHALQGTEHNQGYYYKARIPVAEGAFVFTLTRLSGQTMVHSFKLPLLGIKELPKVYRPYETLRVPVQYDEPPPYATVSYSLLIGSTEFPLVSTRRNPINRYEFDRLPDIQDGAIVFRHILERAPKTGTYPVRIFRQQHIILSKMSGASRTGWVTLSNTEPFTIEVK